MRVNIRSGLLELGFYAVAVAMLAALVHFVTLLMIPIAANHDAYARISELGAAPGTYPLPTVGPSLRRFPFSDPAVASAACRFDLSNGPFRIRAPLGRGGFASLSFHSRRGAVFYALGDKTATRGMMEAVIVTAAQLRWLKAKDDEDNPSEDLRVVSPTSEGFVLQRVFSELPDLMPAAQDEANALDCAPDPLPK